MPIQRSAKKWSGFSEELLDVSPILGREWSPPSLKFLLMKSLLLKLYHSIISLVPKNVHSQIWKNLVFLMQICVEKWRKMVFLGVFSEEKGLKKTLGVTECGRSFGWGRPALCMLLEAGTPCRTAGPKWRTYKGCYPSGHLPGFFNPLGINPPLFWT